jgi:hypothetical protein
MERVGGKVDGDGAMGVPQRARADVDRRELAAAVEREGGDDLLLIFKREIRGNA